MKWFSKMMEGRYGVDQLSLALLIVNFVFFFLSRIPYCWFLAFFSLIPLGIVLFRCFSRNTNKRFLENRAFLNKWNSVKNWFSSKKRKLSQRKTYRFYKCPSCGQSLRVPKGRGKIRITCPKCKTQFIKKT